MNNAKIYQAPEGIDMINNGITYGKQTELEYDSKTTGGKRQCYIYTPPNYDSAAIYPVLYLLHCGGETYSGWLHNGAANEIISNSIARGEAKPMIVVMPNVEASHIDNPPQNFDEQIAAYENFINDLRDDLMPFIKERYPVSAKREQCAIAGASLGGREALFIGIKMPEIFGYLGGFSPSPGLLPKMYKLDKGLGKVTPEEMTFPEAYKDKTFILMCSGKREEENVGIVPILMNDVVIAYQKAFKSNGVKSENYITEGGHDYRAWKTALYHFVKQIF